MKRVLGAALALAVTACAQSGAAQELKFQLKGVRTSQSHYLDQAEIAKVTDGYVGRPIGFSDLQAMMRDLQGLYVQSGVPTAEAVLPAQELSDGILKVELVEAKIEAVEVSGNPRTRSEFLRGNLALQEARHPDFMQIERDLQKFRLSHDLVPRIDFRPGQTVGGTIATIHANEPEQMQGSATLDNHGRSETGRIRANLNFAISSLTGWRDRLSFGYLRTEGAWSGNLGYDRPVGTAGGRAYATGYGSTSRVIGGAHSASKVTSDSHGVIFGYRRPLIAEFDRSLYGFFQISAERSRSKLHGVAFSDTDIREASLGLTWRRALPLTEIGMTGELRLGNARTELGAIYDGGYQTLNLRGFANRQLSANWAGSFDFGGQLSGRDYLPVSREFAVGGQSLRGYPLDVASATEGASLRLQMTRLTPLSLGETGVTAQPFGFFEGAVIGGKAAGSSKLASVGVGANFGLGKTVSLQTLMGVPLLNVDGFTDRGRPRFYAGLTAQF